MKKMKWSFIGVMLVFLSIFVSCNYDDEIEDIYSQLDGIKESILDLQNAYDAGKLIVSVEPSGNSLNDWLITFSDNSVIEITSGKTVRMAILSGCL